MGKLDKQDGSAFDSLLRMSNPVDKIFMHHVRSIKKLGSEINTRNATTKRLLNSMVTFTQTPLVTVRRTAWKNALREMEYFLKGGHHLDDLDNQVNHWWAPFCTKIENSMPYSYGYQMAARYIENPPIDDVVKVKKRKHVESYTEKPIVFQCIGNGPLTGKVFKNKEGEFFEVGGVVEKNEKDSLYEVKFVDSGHLRSCWGRAILKGSCPDLFKKTVAGVGFYGLKTQKQSVRYYARARNIWRNMIIRCYDSESFKFKYYGAKGVRVSKRWHNFSNFLNDLPKIPGFYKWLDYPSFDLDKDYYGSNVYSLDTCIFLNKQQNNDLRKYSPICVREGGEEKFFVTVEDVSNFYDIKRDTVERMLVKKLDKDAISMERMDHSEDFFYRKRIVYSQLDILKDNVKEQPFSRRNILTTWIPEDMTSSLVNPTNCHNSLTQVFVEPSDNSLHMTMYQRSADMVLGVPHNWIAQWAFMLYLSHKTGRKPGTFTWIGGDCHVYPDHEEMVDKIEQEVLLNDGKYEIPNLVYKPTSEEFKADDFSLDIKYEPRIKESLKMTV